MSNEEIFRFFSYYWASSIKDDETEIRIYGLMENTNENVCVIVKDFRPFVYIELPELDDLEWNSVNIDYVKNTLLDEMKPNKYRRGVIDINDYRPAKTSVEKLHKLYYAHYDLHSKEKQKYPFLKMEFDHVEKIKFLINVCRGFGNKGLYIEGLRRLVKLKVQESNASPILQFTSFYNIPTSGWIRCLAQRKEQFAKITLCKHEFVTVSRKLLAQPDMKQVARPMIMSFDLEVYSKDASKMPVATVQENRIFQISCVFHRFGEKMDTCKKYLITFGDPIQTEVGEDVKIIKCKVGDPAIGVTGESAEYALLKHFDLLIRRENPNIITGYNIFGFDISYMKERAKLVGYSNFPNHGLLRQENADAVKEMSWSSSAFKNQKFEYIDAEGRLYLDLLPYIRRNYKFDNYRLKTITEALVGSTKDPLTPKGIFKCYDAGGLPSNFSQLAENKDLRPEYSEHGRKRISVCGKYCVQDSYLVIELMNKVHAWVDLTELAKICNVSISDLYIKGQQIRVFSQIYKKCRGNHVVQQNECVPNPDDHYQGAIVFDPVPGMYDNVIPFDFSSLYPTSIIAENIDFSTLVLDDDVPDKLCNVIEWDEHYGCEHDKTKRKSKTKYILCSHQKFRYLKEPKGILPSLLEDLIAARKQTKKEIEEVEEKLKECLSNCTSTTTHLEEKKNLELYLAVLDKRQLAFKVCANSGYGAMGVQKGYLPFMPGAKCTTAVGRRSIEKVAKFIPEKFGGKLIYGDTDSNYIHFPAFEGKSAAEIWDYAVFVADETSKLFKKPMKLEFECKIYTRFLILTKKRYMCLSCKRDGVVSNKIDKKGVLLARRDNAKVVRDIYSNIIMRLFYKEDRDEVVYSLLTMINNLCSGVLPSKDFVITKSVGDLKKRKLDDLEMQEYGLKLNIKETFLLENIQTKYRKLKNGSKEITKATIGNYTIEVLSKDPDERKAQLAQKNVETEHEYYLKSLPSQVQLAEKMRKRGQIVAAGSRMEFLVITDGSIYNMEKEKLYEKLEDIVYYNNHSSTLEIDYLYYLKALANPMDEVLSVIYGNDDLLADCSLKKDFVLKQFKYRLLRVQMLQELKSLFKSKVKIVDEAGNEIVDLKKDKKTSVSSSSSNVKAKKQAQAKKVSVQEPKKQTSLQRLIVSSTKKTD